LRNSWIRTEVRRAGEFRDVAPILVPRVTSREGVKELAYSRGGVALIMLLQVAGARVSAFDSLSIDNEIRASGAKLWNWGDSGLFRAYVPQTADPAFASLGPRLFPDIRVAFDGRNNLGGLAPPASVAYAGVGVQGSNSHAPDAMQEART